MTQTAKPALPRRLRWLLIGSLTLNLLVAGVVAGTALRFAGGDPPPRAARTLAFGPWSGALGREDYKALRRGYDASGHDFRADWRAERADRAALVATLRAEPFDGAALEAVAARMQARGMARMELGQRLIRDHIAAMTPEARRALADRLEQGQRPPRERPPERAQP